MLIQFIIILVILLPLLITLALFFPRFPLSCPLPTAIKQISFLILPPSIFIEVEDSPVREHKPELVIQQSVLLEPEFQELLLGEMVAVFIVPPPVRSVSVGFLRVRQLETAVVREWNVSRESCNVSLWDLIHRNISINIFFFLDLFFFFFFFFYLIWFFFLFFFFLFIF